MGLREAWNFVACICTWVVICFMNARIPKVRVLGIVGLGDGFFEVRVCMVKLEVMCCEGCPKFWVGEFVGCVMLGFCRLRGGVVWVVTLG